MLLGGGSSCQACGCKSCICTATCTEPHTGDPFEVVYTRFFEGAEAGNPTDGYLTATGDSDTSDPYDGMDGSGPWFQRVSGGFTLGGPSPGTRIPCEVRVSFWRNNYTLGASTIPPASTAVTENVVEVIVSSGALIAPDGTVITPADGAVAISSVPLVAGNGDASELDPRTGEGTVSYRSRCWNVETIFTIRATVRWNTQKRQHVLYGIVRECYEDSNPCSCDGDPFNDELYVEISGFTDPYGLGIPPEEVNGTYVAERFSNTCDQWKYAHGVIGLGYSVFHSQPFFTIYGTHSLRIYSINYGQIPLADYGVSYQCGTGTMGTLTSYISLWYTYEFGSQDINAGTITIRVFK